MNYSNLILFSIIFLLGAANPSWLALLPKGVQGPKGGFVWYTKEIVDWIHGPVPASLYKPETK